MSQLDEAKATAKQLQNGLARLGEGRTVALSVHKTKELVAQMEEQIAQIITHLDSAS